MKTTDATLQAFFYEGKKVRTVQKDGEQWWVLKDICSVLGISNSHDVSARLKEDEKGVDLIDSLGGRQKFTIINESGLYNVILRSDKPEADRFRRWVTHEVLPSIRKHGAYITTSKMEEILNDPENLVRLLNSLKTENKQLQLQIENDRPKILFADAITTSHCTILVGELAKILKGNGVEIGQNRLFEHLRRRGFLIKRKSADYNSPTQKSMKLGLFSIRETATLHSDGHVSISKTVKVTGKGQLYFVNFFLNKAKQSISDNQQSFPNFLNEIEETL
ncbi:MAG: phage antirepressor KilAC domain-containing protein [Holosporaceae bacterium]|jgi:anti-repressor protein|nr:phage antirepressor KilAC domain-containing protein [Holosporaceae bacterium]